MEFLQKIDTEHIWYLAEGVAWRSGEIKPSMLYTETKII